MAKKSRDEAITGLHNANGEESYEWLARDSPVHLDAVETAVQAGLSPDEIWRIMYRDTGRQEIAHRCRLAARYIQAMGE